VPPGSTPVARQLPRPVRGAARCSLAGTCASLGTLAHRLLTRTGMTAMSAATIHLAPGLSRAYLLHHRVCPVALQPDGCLAVAVTANALLDSASDDLRLLYGCELAFSEVGDDELDRLVERLTTRSESAVELAIEAKDETDGFASDIRQLAALPPVVRYVNLLVRDAFEAGASDIHLEATREGLAARVRVDGVLSQALTPPNEYQHAVVSRLKLLAELDIAERRRPQDGRIRVRLDTRELDLRVSTVPSIHGESMVLRLLERGGRPVELSELGMAPDTLNAVTRLVSRPHGMILVTGPTGSGKTTTLYAALGRRDSVAEKIITVEDPIEYHIEGVTQVPVHRQAGVTFASALRSILRQDPDVVMVGEIRDTETAEIAVQAAMTGHLVFSTLHTNDSVGAIARLLDLNVPDYLIAGTVDAILAQRLVRRICRSCVAEHVASPEHIALLAGRSITSQPLYRGAGCSRCRGTGYSGRVGIFELLILNDDLRDAIVRHASTTVLRQIAAGAGLTPLLQDGWSKVQSGVTTVEEVLRVVQN
jgi:type II secretory ATPase GspE/PulE/Tfp pilus assembly ATPase PilB-like protein